MKFIVFQHKSVCQLIASVQLSQLQNHMISEVFVRFENLLDSRIRFGLWVRFLPFENIFIVDCLSLVLSVVHKRLYLTSGDLSLHLLSWFRDFSLCLRVKANICTDMARHRFLRWLHLSFWLNMRSIIQARQAPISLHRKPFARHARPHWLYLLQLLHRILVPESLINFCLLLRQSSEIVIQFDFLLRQSSFSLCSYFHFLRLCNC